MLSECLCWRNGIDVSVVDVLIFMNWELELYLEEEHDVDPGLQPPRLLEQGAMFPNLS